MQPKNPWFAAIYSLVIPGTGHIYLEQFTVGVILASVYAGAWAFVLLTAGGKFSLALLAGIAVGSATAAYVKARKDTLEEGAQRGAKSRDRALKPIPVERFMRELEHMASERRSGNLSREAYEQRLARTIGELRSRKIAGDRVAIVEALEDLKARAVIEDQDWNHLINRLGL